MGDYCYVVALPWMVLSGHGSPQLLGSVLACYGITRVACVPVAGAVIDRLDPRRLLVYADVIRLAGVLVIGLAGLHGTPSLAVLGPTAAVLGVGTGIFMPAAQVILPAILDEDDLNAGNSVFTVFTEVATLTGPPVGGAVVLTAGASAGMFADAASYAVSAVALILIRTAAPAEAGTGASGPAGPEPVSFGQVLRHGRFLQGVLLIGVAGNLMFTGCVEIALPVLSHRSFGAGGYGALLSALGVGTILGAILAGRVKGGQRPMLLAIGLGLVMAVAIGVLPFAGGLPGALVCMAVFALANTWSGILITTALQVWSPPSVLGRVMSTLILATSGLFPVATWLSGLVVRAFDVTGFFPAAGAGIAAAVVIAFAMPAFRRLRPGEKFAVSSPLADAADPLEPFPEMNRMAEFDALAALRTAGHPVDLLSVPQQEVLAALSEDEVVVLNRVKQRLDEAAPDVLAQELKFL